MYILRLAFRVNRLPMTNPLRIAADSFFQPEVSTTRLTSIIHFLHIAKDQGARVSPPPWDDPASPLEVSDRKSDGIVITVIETGGDITMNQLVSLFLGKMKNIDQKLRFFVFQLDGTDEQYLVISVGDRIGSLKLIKECVSALLTVD